MDYNNFFIEIISRFLTGIITRKEVSYKVAMELPVDIVYNNYIELMENCEWALRHINEIDYWTSEKELQYYLSCLKGERQFSVEDRNNSI